MITLDKPTLQDIPTMTQMVSSEVKEGTILARTEDEIATNIRSYIIARQHGRIVGYTALHIYSPRLAEIRSLIVESAYRRTGVGYALVSAALEEAKNIKIQESVLVLTFLPEFFKKLGFHTIEKAEIPEQKIWADCIKCVHFPVCNEVAMVYKVV